MVSPNDCITSRRTILAGGLATLASCPFASASGAAPTGSDVRASGLVFPEGPCVTGSGDLLFVEIGGGRLCRLSGGHGPVQTVATLGGGPNGCAIGPDSAAYVANNGGLTFKNASGHWLVSGIPADYHGGSIQRVDLKSGAVTTLYTRAGDNDLKGPNDIVFDAWGGMWFTDTGKIRPRARDLGGLYWALPDGSAIREMAYPLNAPNGIAIGADRRTLYVALSDKRQVVAYTLTGPGTIEMAGGAPKSRIFAAPAGAFSIDNIACEEGGGMVLAAVGYGGLVTLAPDGSVSDMLKLDDVVVTAMAFGGPDRRTLYVTLSGSGRIVAIPWPRAGVASTYGKLA